MKKYPRFFLSVAFVAAAILSSANAFGANPNTAPAKSELGPQPVANARVVECLSWLNPHAETVWEKTIETSPRLLLRPRMNEFLSLKEQKATLEKLKDEFLQRRNDLNSTLRWSRRLMCLPWVGAFLCWLLARWLIGLSNFLDHCARKKAKKANREFDEEKDGSAWSSFAFFLSVLLYLLFYALLAVGVCAIVWVIVLHKDPERKDTDEGISKIECQLEALERQIADMDVSQAEGRLEAFGTRYMPNAYAQYQEVRGKALELKQVVKENFPEGKASDPTGGTMFKKSIKNLSMAVAKTFRRHDELCFFLLFHQAGIFSDDELAEYDARPISIHLESELPDWPDDTPKSDTALAAEDATFAAKYLPETHAGYQRLCDLFDEGAKQYAELRQTALALDAPRARLELGVLKRRLLEIQAALQRYKQDISGQRLENALGETPADSFAALDHATALKIQDFARETELRDYVVRVAKRLIVTLPGGATMEMVWCPPGTFTMGSPEGEKGRFSDETQHQVTLTKGFWMAKYEVTQEQWMSVMGNNPSDHKGNNLPVEKVSWYGCREFCQKTGLSMPTEAQWESACRAGSTGPYAGTGNLDDMGWYNGNSDGKTHPVGQKNQNAWGLHDMHGNVEEWCADGDGYYPSGAVTDPWGMGSGYSYRGGDYRGISSYCRSANRGGTYPGNSSSTLGFRPVSIQP